MTLQAGGNAPYAPATAVTELLSRYRSRGLTTPITTEVVERAGVSPTLTRRTVQALKLLELINDDGMPTDQFDTMSRAPEADYKRLLGEHLAAVYAEVFAFADPATDGYDRIRDAFRGFDPKGQQERMITLFLGLMEYAGQDVSAALASRRQAPANGPKAKPKAAASTLTGRYTPKGPKAQQKGTAAAVVAAGEPGGLPPGLLGLLHQIPRDGGGWTQGRRDTFLAAFEAVLDFSVPIVAKKQPAGDVEGVSSN